MPKFDYRQVAPPTDTVPARGPAAWFADRPQLPYLLPFFAYVVFFLPAAFGPWWEQAWKVGLPFIYAAKTVTAGVMLWYFWPWYTAIRWTKLPLGAVVGLFGTVLWIALTYASQHMGIARAAHESEMYNPDVMIPVQWQRWVFLSIRVAGPTLVVPVMEELFFRDYLMRALIRGGHFSDVPVGAFSWVSLLGMSAFFAINHGFNMLLPGFFYGLMMGILLIRTKSLGACIVAHAFTNWSLYLYVIYRGDWQFM